MNHAARTLRTASEALREAIAALMRGEPFEALAWLHSAKAIIGEVEEAIERERAALRPPQQTGA
jgi:hypothetical protein